MGITYEWRGTFSNAEANNLHAEAFQTRAFSDEEWNWVELTARHSLGWVVARRGGEFVGFVNVVWDGLVPDIDLPANPVPARDQSSSAPAHASAPPR